MFLIVTRNYPPDVGGMQMLMGGLSESLLNHGPVKVFADEYPNSDLYDNKISISIERVKGIKLFRKYRKGNLVNNFINTNDNIRALIADHWKSLELINTDKKKYCLIHGKEINHPKGSSLNKRIIKVLNNVSNSNKKLPARCGRNANVDGWFIRKFIKPWSR